MIHYIYKTTCLCGSVAGHYYIGKHTTNNINDNYAGSGVAIRDYFKKYGKADGITYKKEILEYNDTQESNASRERDILGNLWLVDPLCMNLMEGGGNEGVSFSDEHKMKISQSLKGVGKTESTRKKLSESMKGKSHPQSNETKKKISDALKGKPSKLKGTKLAESHKIKIAKNSIGNRSRTGMPHSEETKRKMRESALKRWETKKGVARLPLPNPHI